MPRKNVFIAHRWQYTDDYNRISACLDRTKFDIADYSDPKCDPLTIGGTHLTHAIHNQIDRAGVVFVSNRPAITNSDWVVAEINYALKGKKSIIAVKCTDSTASWITERNIPVVACRKDSLENAIGNL
jgi:hypothetical protein